MENKTRYSFAADFLRAAAAIGVVMLHSFDTIYLRPDFFGGKVWWLTHLIGMLCRSAVPLFIMLSGYLTLNRGKSLPDMWKKAIHRIAIPAASVFLLYFAFDLFDGRLTGSLSSIVKVFIDRLNMNTSTHLFFLVILFYLYLATPFFNTLFSYSRKIQLSAIIGFFGLTLLSLLANITTFTADSNIYNTYTTWIFYIGYFLLGYYARDVKWSSIKERVFLGVFLASYIIGTLGSYWVYAQRQEPVISLIPYFSNYFSLTIVLQSVALFFLIMKGSLSSFAQKMSGLSFGVKVVAAQSFGLYLFHLLVMYWIDFNVNASPSGGLIPFLLLSTAAIFLVSLSLVIFLRRTSLRFLIGE